MKARKFLLLVYFAIAGFGQLFAAPGPRLLKPIGQLSRSIPSLFAIPIRTHLSTGIFAGTMAVHDLIRFDPEHAPAAFALLRSFVKDSDKDVRFFTAETLSRLIISKLPPQQALEVAELLERLVKDPEEEVRYHTANTLGKAVNHEPLSSAAWKLMESLAKDADDDVREHTARALRQEKMYIKSEPAAVILKLLRFLAKDKNRFVRWQAAASLRNLRCVSSQSWEAVGEVLASLASDPDKDVHRCAQGLMEGCGDYDLDTRTVMLSGRETPNKIVEDEVAASSVEPKRPVSKVFTVLKEYQEHLRVIDLSDNMMGIAAATDIINFANDHLPKLGVLYLQGNQISPVKGLTESFTTSVQTLLKSDKFKRLDIRYNGIAYAGWVNQFPGAKLVWAPEKKVAAEEKEEQTKEEESEEESSNQEDSDDEGGEEDSNEEEDSDESDE